MSRKRPRPEDLAPRLLTWYDASKRALPWRGTRDPYRVWVSEIMLQQTQVATVIPYYERFLGAFPTVRDLATAPLDEVLRLWSGLGYYRRARGLHAAAGVVLERHGGRFPETPEAALALPGVGRYTAGAILSIAYGVRLPAVDANAERVLARVHLIEGDIGVGEPKRRVLALAAEAVPGDRPGDHNQALMELGALVCAPRAPRCADCPLADVCAAWGARAQERVPAARTRTATVRVEAVAGIVRRSGRVLIARRPDDAVWGGLWEFPNTETSAEGDRVERLTAHLRDAHGLRVTVGLEVARIAHSVMDRRITLIAMECTSVSGRTRAAWHTETAWARPADLSRYAMPSPHRRIAERLHPPG